MVDVDFTKPGQCRWINCTCGCDELFKQEHWKQKYYSSACIARAAAKRNKRAHERNKKRKELGL